MTLAVLWFVFYAVHERQCFHSYFFFFNDTATTEIYTLSLHDALPISSSCSTPAGECCTRRRSRTRAPPSPIRSRSCPRPAPRDRKSTRLNSSHGYISYAVFCLKKKKQRSERLSILKRHTITVVLVAVL